MPHSKILALLTGLVVLACTISANAGVNEWTFHGPIGGGGQATALAVNPTNSPVVLLGTPRGIHRSTDGGHSWTLVRNDTRPPSAIAFDPSAANRVVVSDGNLYVSADSGATFAALQKPAQGDVAEIAFGPTGQLYVGLVSGRLFRSASPFTNWTEITGGWAANSLPRAIDVDLTDPEVIYLGIGDAGLYRSDDDGASWTGPLTNGFTNNGLIQVNDFAVNPADPNWIVAATGQGTFVTLNRGASWFRTDFFSTYWVAFDPVTPNAMAALRPFEVMRSGDNGATWSVAMNLRADSTSGASFVPGAMGRLLIANSSGLAITNYNLNGVEYGLGGLTGIEVRDIAASADGTVYAAMTAGTADVFIRSGSEFVPLDYFQTLPATTLPRRFTSIAVAAGNSQQVYAVNRYVELIRTFDGGAHWTTAHPAFSPFAADSTADVEIDPGNPAVAYVARVPSGIWKTTDSGTNFALLAGSPTYAIAVAVSPHDSQVVYAAGGPSTDSGIYKSTDGGAHWVEQVAPGAAQRYFHSFAFHPLDPNTVYAATSSISYKTTNGGATWTPIVFPGLVGSSPIYSLLFDPLIPTTMVAVSGVQGFYRSVDGGTTWKSTYLGAPGTQVNIRGGVLDSDPAVVIVATDTAGVAEYRVAPDLGLAMTSFSTPMPVGGAVNTTFTVTNVGLHDSSASELQIDVPAWLTPSAAGCTHSGQSLRCPFGAIKVGESRNVQVSFAVDSSAQGDSQIDARLTGHETDWETANNIAGQLVQAAEIADIDVAITAGATTVDRGSSTNVTVIVSNAGPSPSTSTQLEVRLPANMSASSIATNRGSCSQASGIISCALNTLAANTSANITFALRGDAVGAVTLTAEASGNGHDVDGTRNDARAFTVRPVGDMTVSLSESEDPVTVGASFQYNLTVTNVSGDAGEFTVTIPLTGATVTSANANFGDCSLAGSTVTCSGLGLGAGAVGSIAIGLVGNLPGIATATATVAYAGTETNLANNSASIGTTLRLVGDVSVTIVDNADPVALGVAYMYLVTVHNAGPNAGAVQVVIPVSNAAISDATSASFTCTHTAGSATCNALSLGGNTTATISVTAASLAGGTATAAATVTFGGVDTNPANDSTTHSTTINRTGDIAVELARSADSVIVGRALSYTATVRNLGPNAGDVHLTLMLTGGTAASVTPSSGGTCMTNLPQTRVDCDFNSMASGGSATASIAMATTVDGMAGVGAQAAFSGNDPALNNNVAVANTTITVAPPSGSSSGGGGGGAGGGGGGGRFDWLATMLLGVLLAARGRRLMFAGE